MISPRRKRLFIVTMLAGFLVFQELLLRAVFVMPAVSGFNRMSYTPLRDSVADMQTHAGLCNVKIRYESSPDGFEFDHTLNIYGFRGPDFEIPPSPDRARVLLIGDSFVEGCGVADDDTLSKQFERLTTKQRVEAINLGVAGIGFIEYSEIFRDAVPLLRPRTVFLVTCSNDLPMLPQANASARPVPVIRPQSAWAPRIVQIVERLMHHESLPRRTHRAPTPFFDPVPSPRNRLSSHQPPPNIDPEVLAAMKAGKCNPWNAAIESKYAQYLQYDYSVRGGVKERLRQFADLCRQQNCQLIVVYIPYDAQVNPIYIAAQNKLGGTPIGPLDGPQFFRQQEHLRIACKSAGILFIDTTEAFTRAERETNQRYFWPIDAHCNARGYELIAKLCVETFSR